MTEPNQTGFIWHCDTSTHAKQYISVTRYNVESPLKSQANVEVCTIGRSPHETNTPTIVMLHEGLGCIDLWREFPLQLHRATGLSILLYSRLGYGQSDDDVLPRPLDYMTLEATEILPQVLQHAGVKQCVLLGHSDGASIAAAYAGSIDDSRVRGIILIAPHFFTETHGLSSIKAVTDNFKSDKSDLPKKMGKYHHNPRHTFLGWSDAWLDPNFVDWDISDVIDFFRVPVLAIQGVEDQYGSEAQIDEITSRATAPICKLMIEKTKHSPHLEKPELTVNKIQKFINRLLEQEAILLPTSQYLTNQHE